MGAGENSAQSAAERLVAECWLRHHNQVYARDFHLADSKPDAQPEHQSTAAPDFIASDRTRIIGIEVKGLHRDRKAGARNAVWTRWFSGLEQTLTQHVPPGSRYMLRTRENIDLAGLGRRTSPSDLAARISPLIPVVPADDKIHRYELEGLPFWIELRRRERPGPGKIYLSRILKNPVETSKLVAYLSHVLTSTRNKFAANRWATSENVLLLENKEYTLLDHWTVSGALRGLYPSEAFSRISHVYLVDRIDEIQPDIFELPISED